jgi:metallophosphoesterase (TIGR00282 family)
LKVLTIGDVVGNCGCRCLKQSLSRLKIENNIDLTIVNGENSAAGNGITPDSAEYIFSSGADVITGGNHTFRRYTIFDYLKKPLNILRPANYPKNTPGKGFVKFKIGRIEICVINLIGTNYLESMACPFETLDNILYKNEISSCSIKIVDFHAEATSEKRALGFFADGRVSVVFGTHTHVQTSDEEILPRGTGYITDLGMTGVANSVLGVKTEISIKRMKNKIPLKFEQSEEGICKIECAVFDINENNGKTVDIKRIRLYEKI